MLLSSLVVTDPVGTNKSADETLLYQNTYPEDISENQLRVELSSLITNYITICQKKGWQVEIEDERNYEWRKRVTAIDAHGRLRAVRDFAVVAAWEGEI